MATLTVFTYNLRTDVPEDGINSFQNRRDFIRARFPAYQADLIGFQETEPHMRQWLMEAFPEYEVCGTGREAALDGESNVIAYRRSLFDLVSLDTFWLSDTPYVPGSRFSTDQSLCPRICTCVTLCHKETGKLLRHYNTHLDHEGAMAQAQGISLVLNRMAADYARWQAPVILTGDFNVVPESPVYRSVQGFSGCGKPLVDVTAGVGDTFHNFEPQNPAEQMKIDYIFTNLPCDPKKTVKAMDEQNGQYLSDHYPVGAYLAF